MKKYELTAITCREKEGYVSECSELGRTSVGDNVGQALKSLKEAVELYLENAKELGIFERIKYEFCFNKRFTAPFEVSLA